MPLHRGADGSLGVKSRGGDNSNVVNFNQTINVQNGDPASVRKASAAGAREVLAVIGTSNRYR
jgi:hypothetical protein